MIHTKLVMQSISAGDWFQSLDLKDAYFHIPIYPDHRPFLHLLSRARCSSFTFGLSLAPRIFTRVVSAALAPLQLQGLKILPYLNDRLICAPSRDQVIQDTERVLTHIQSLRFTVNWKKSNLQPQQQVSFLGLHFDSVTMNVCLTPHRGESLERALRHFQLGKHVMAHRVQKLLGLIAAASAVIALGLLRARPIQRWFNSFGLHPKRDRRIRLLMTCSCRWALLPWRDRDFLLRGTPLGNLPHRWSIITTDASLTGWGAV